jgi:thiosulfate/3-mercaptopyruvate sulfurtransferase
MTQTYTTTINASALETLLDTNASLRIFDCRARLGDPDQGAVLFADGHIAGALRADLDADLAAPPSDKGRHPLPAFAAWLAQVKQWGLQDHEQVVLYDDMGGQMAARGWWMFRWLGHEATAVLDGGLQQWQRPLESGAPSTPNASDYRPKQPLTRLWQVQDVEHNLSNPSHQLLDARSAERFRGEQEPIDPVAGHIPSAICLPSTDNLAPSGLFKTAEDLGRRFANIMSTHTVCYCGSGVTATHNILAMRLAGLAEPVLYADSWSGWITDSHRPIAASDT